MSDQCQHCSLKGDLKLCQSVPCTTHESWYVSGLQQKLEQAEAQVKQCQGSLMRLNARHNLDEEKIEAVENAYLFHTKESINIVKAAAIREAVKSLSDSPKEPPFYCVNWLEQYAQSLLDNAKGDE